MGWILFFIISFCVPSFSEDVDYNIDDPNLLMKSGTEAGIQGLTQEEDYARELLNEAEKLQKLPPAAEIRTNKKTAPR